MRHLHFFDGGFKYDQITIKEARRRFLSGERILICAAKIKPFNPWGGTFFIKAADHPEEEPGAVFDHYVNSFTWYNCNYEVGKYPVFYKEEAAQ